MSKLKQATDAIVSRLKADLFSNQKTSVVAFNDKVEDYDRVQRYSRVFVFCAGVQRQTTTPVAIAAPLEHQETLLFNIVIQASSLSNSDGCHELDEIIAQKLDNWSPLDDGRALVRGDYKYIRTIEGVWEYRADYKLTSRSQARVQRI